MPRALMMTAMARLGLCDLFIHGTGGANYDRAMELWIREWLGVEVGSVAMATADSRLPLMEVGESGLDLATVTAAARRAWHDPSAGEGGAHPSEMKRQMVLKIAGLARNSPQRRAAFMSMHGELATLRGERQQTIERVQRDLEYARRRAADLEIARRRDWAFSLYPREMIDGLAAQARAAVNCG